MQPGYMAEAGVARGVEIDILGPSSTVCAPPTSPAVAAS